MKNVIGDSWIVDAKPFWLPTNAYTSNATPIQYTTLFLSHPPWFSDKSDARSATKSVKPFKGILKHFRCTVRFIYKENSRQASTMFLLWRKFTHKKLNLENNIKLFSFTRKQQYSLLMWTLWYFLRLWKLQNLSKPKYNLCYQWDEGVSKIWLEQWLNQFVCIINIVIIAKWDFICILDRQNFGKIVWKIKF